MPPFAISRRLRPGALSPRRLAVLTLLALVGLAVLLSTAGSSRRAVATPDPYQPPVATDTNPDPNVVETTIKAEPATVDVNTSSRSTR